MFWKYNSPSSIQIDALLEKENVSLHELMEEDELLQECKVQNKKLVEYLIQPDVLKNLVDLVTSDPPQDKELEIRYKQANLACELLTCDVPQIIEKLSCNQHLLDMLYKFLEKEKPLNPLLASFVSKVLGMLVTRRSEQNWYVYQFTCFQVIDFLRKTGAFVKVAVKHIGTSAVMDLLFKLVCGVDNDDPEIQRGIHEWLNDDGLIELLIEKLSPDCDSEEHSSVDQLIQEIIITGTALESSSNTDSNGSSDLKPMLLDTIESDAVIDKLMDLLLHEDRNESSVSHVINILLKILAFKNNKQSNSRSSSKLDCEDNISTVLNTILSRLPELHNILTQSTKLQSIETSFGFKTERLGNTRLQVVKLIAALIETNNFEVHFRMASFTTLQILFDLFYKFSLNNFLHTHVTSCINNILSQSVCSPIEITDTMKEVEVVQEEVKETIPETDGLNNNPTEPVNIEHEPIQEFNAKDFLPKKEVLPFESLHSDPLKHPLLKVLFVECNVIQSIISLYNKQEEENNLEDNKSHNLCGYMGHVREIANAIVTYSSEGPNSRIIKTLVDGLSTDVQTDWSDFVEVGLAVENLKNKVLPIQSFKEGDMDSASDLRFNDDEFKDAEDHLSGALQRLSSQMGDSSGPDFDDNTSGEAIELFEEACSQKFSYDKSAFEDMWKFKEKTITFGSFDKNSEDEEASHSSSEDEGDLDNEFDSLRANEEKMEVDYAPENAEDWTDIFNKKTRSGSLDGSFTDPGFNPWQSAPASDTQDNNSWADFGSSVSVIEEKTSSSAEFQADFSNVFLVNSQADQKPLQPNVPNDSTASTMESLQDICDLSQAVENVQESSAITQESTMMIPPSDSKTSGPPTTVQMFASALISTNEEVFSNELESSVETNEDKIMEEISSTSVLEEKVMQLESSTSLNKQQDSNINMVEDREMQEDISSNIAVDQVSEEIKMQEEPKQDLIEDKVMAEESEISCEEVRMSEETIENVIPNSVDETMQQDEAIISNESESSKQAKLMEVEINTSKEPQQDIVTNKIDQSALSNTTS